MGPVPYAVPIPIALERATGKATSAVTGVQGPADRRRDDPGLSTDIERLALLILEDDDQAGIAGQPSRGLGRNGQAVLQLAAAGMTVLQCLGVDMHDDLLALSASEFLRARAQEALGHGRCNPRQLLRRVRDPHFLPRRPEPDPALPDEPMGTGLRAPLRLRSSSATRARNRPFAAFECPAGVVISADRTGVEMLEKSPFMGHLLSLLLYTVPRHKTS